MNGLIVVVIVLLIVLALISVLGHAIWLLWTWLWHVAGIATGATIIFMFAVFEKKRGEVLRVVEGFKDWEV